MLKVLTGSDTSQKNKYFFDQIARSYQDNGRSVVVIVPEQFTLTMEQVLIDHLNLDGLMGIEVTSLTRLVNKVASQLVESDRTPLNALGRKLLIRKIIEDHRGDMTVYQKSYQRLGLIHEIERMLVNFKNEKVTCEDLKDFRDNLDPHDVLVRKLDDLMLVFSAYNRQVDESYIDETQRIQQFIQYMDFVPELDGADVYFYGFSGFSMQEIETIEAIDNKVHQIMLLLNHQSRDQHSIFQFTQKTLNQIRQHFGEIEIEEYSQKEDQAMLFARHLGLYDEIKTDHAVEKFTARSIYSECQYVAGEIHRLIVKKGYDINDIHVMLLDSQTYRPILTRALDQYGIPYFADEKSSLIDTHIIQAILSLLKFFETNFSTAALFEYLKMIVGQDNLHQIDQLENFALAKGIDYSIWKKSIDDDEMESIRKQWVDPLINHGKKFSEPITIEEFSERLMKILENLGIRQQIDETVKMLKSNGLEDEVLKMTQVWNKFVDIVEQIKEASGDREMTLPEHVAYLEMAFEDEKIGLIPAIVDGVRIYVLERSVFLPNRVTFYMGMSEKNLPKAQGDSKVLTEGEKEKLFHFGIDLKDDSRFYRQKEMLDLYTALSKTEEKCYLTYPINDLRGKAMEPSYYIKRAVEILNQIVEKNDLVDDEVFIDQWLCHKEHLKMNLLRQLRNYRSGLELSPKWTQIAEAYQGNFPKEVEVMLEDIFYSNMTDQMDRSFRLDKLTTSITRLEKFANCPFAYFATYDLKLRERKIHEVTAIEIGNLYHELLEKAIRNRMEGKEGITVKMIVDQLLAEEEYSMFRASEKSNYLISRIVHLAEKITENIDGYYGNSQFTPVFAEVAFSSRDDSAEFSPIVIPIDERRQLIIEGKIDRIDSYTKTGDGIAYCNVIDYKTGKKNLELGKILAGIDYQLPVYLMACKNNPEAFHSEQVAVSGVFYYRIHDDLIELGTGKVDEDIKGKWSMKGMILDDSDVISAMDMTLGEEGYGKSEYLPIRLKKDGEPDQYTYALDPIGFDYLMAETENQMLSVGRKMTNGRIDIEPVRAGSDTACKFCEYRNVCKFETKFYDNKYRELDVMSNKEAKEFLKAVKGGGSDDKMV